MKFGRNQAICISGESGAGKTEAAKLCLSFMTEIMDEPPSEVHQMKLKDKILATSPILEAFGNATTYKNDNSSRFGKYFTIYTDWEKNRKKLNILGAEISIYLLEKCRVTQSSKSNERNYHIFYALCRFAPKEMLSKYKLLNSKDKCDMSKFNYLNKTDRYQVDKVNDSVILEEVIKAFTTLNFSTEEVDGVWRALSIILNLGNCVIDDSNFSEGYRACHFQSNSYLSNVLNLLEIDIDFLEKSICNRKIVDPNTNDVIWSPIKKAKCQAIIDSMAKALYKRLYHFINKKCNETIMPESMISNKQMYKRIGMLDIFGFENFDINSLEQFCINYTNEKLQHLYIRNIFINEKEIFRKEGLIDYIRVINYVDNENI